MHQEPNADPDAYRILKPTDTLLHLHAAALAQAYTLLLLLLLLAAVVVMVVVVAAAAVMVLMAVVHLLTIFPGA